MPLYPCLLKNKLKRFNDFYPTYDTHQACSYYMVIIALYLMDVLFGEVRIPFIVGKIQNKIILRRMLHLSYIQSSSIFFVKH